MYSFCRCAYSRAAGTGNNNLNTDEVKVCNLYAGLGGNRKLWTDVEVTAVELNPSIAKFYQDHFPNDKVIIADAHRYLLEHYSEFDFIWSSINCPSHSRARFWGSRPNKKTKPIFQI